MVEMGDNTQIWIHGYEVVGIALAILMCRSERFQIQTGSREFEE